MELSKCDTEDECLKPYCIGNDKCTNTNSEQICKTDDNINLNKCTDKLIGDNDYVYYYYKSNPITAIIPNSLMAKQILTQGQQPQKSNLLFYVLTVLGIIFCVFIILFGYNFMKKKKLKR
jgi:ribosomal protein S4E